MSLPEVARAARFDFIRYASVWEDADVLCEALGSARGGKLLSIASAGDNVLALLTLDPRGVTAIDLNPAQLACLELRIAAFRLLDDDAVVRFLGVERDRDRWSTYQRLRNELSGAVQTFWDGRPETIRRGIIHAGKFERYLRGFRRWVLPLVHPETRIRSLLSTRDAPERERFYREEWDTPRWRGLFRVFFSRALLGCGRDPAFLKHVRGPISGPLLRRTRHAFTALPTCSNPYLAYIVTGSFPKYARPRYLRREWMGVIRERLDRIRVVLGSVEGVDDEGFDGLNLSDVFEYMSLAEHARSYRALAERCRAGARMVYWNMLAPRACPAEDRSRVEPQMELAARLHARDRAWFYSALHIDEVRT